MGKDMEMLNDDDLNMVNGGAGIVKNSGKKATKKISYKTKFICPNCKTEIDLEFYTDGTQNYQKCPNPSCGRPIAVG